MLIKNAPAAGKQLLMLILFLFPAMAVVAQPAYSKQDSAKIYAVLHKVDEQVMEGSYEEALLNIKQVLQLTRQTKMLRGEGFALLKKADILVQQSDDANLDSTFLYVMKIAARLKDSFMLALAYYQQGQYYMYNTRYEEAEKLFDKALTIRFEKEQSGYTGLVYNDLGYLYGGIGNMEKQVYWYLKASRVLEQNGDLAGYATTASSLGTVYFNLGQTDEAIRQIKEAIVIREKIGDVLGLAYSYGNLARICMNTSIDSAARYQQAGIRYAEKSGVKRAILQGYDNASILANRQKKNTEALDYAKKAIAICEELNDKAGIANRYMWSAVISNALQHHEAVEDYYGKAQELSTALNNKPNLRDLYASKANYYKTRNDFKAAYENQQLYYLYRDSIINQQTETNIAGLKLQYETEKKDNEIIRLHTGQKIQQLELEKQQAVIAGNKLEAQQKQNEIDLLVKRRELQDLKLKQQGEQLEKQLLLSQTNQQQLVLAQQEKEINAREIQNQKQFRNAVIIGAILVVLLGLVLFNRFQLKKKLEQQQAMQSIRNDIARDLHDEIGSTLTSINILSAYSQKKLQRDKTIAIESLQQITEQSQGMQQAMSDIVWAIKPDNDKMQNMAVRMREFITHTLEPKNILVEMEADKEVLQQTLPMEQRRDFFLIFKEAVNNAAKYSKATTVRIQIDRRQNNIQLLIQDNGIGFDPLKPTISNGLKNMKERAKALRGQLQIESSPGTGTRITLLFTPTY